MIELMQPSQIESWISINIKFGLDLSTICPYQIVTLTPFQFIH